MRPIKSFFVEEYWEIAYREHDKKTIFEKNTFSNFNTLKATKRYWYADPILFDYNGETFLFVEAFDNAKQKGKIAYSKYINGVFTSPKIIIEEKFHLSYPLVFEKNGEIFMMPETSEDKCIQLYRAVQFPEKWEKYERLIELENAVDTVILEEDKLLTSMVINPYQKTTRLDLIDLKKNNIQQCSGENQNTRGAGKIFDYKGDKIRPAQNADGGIYGKGICFYKILDTDKYKEEKILDFDYKSVDAENIIGVHTYARNNILEVIDCKKKRLNLLMIFWVIKSKMERK